ncbi:MAG: hypothetical protein OXH04_08625, partial [Acidobacteria bacterium]|nr:hypothetical protein [Acidobacteriota bacterium]
MAVGAFVVALARFSSTADVEPAAPAAVPADGATQAGAPPAAGSEQTDTSPAAESARLDAPPAAYPEARAAEAGGGRAEDGTGPAAKA